MKRLFSFILPPAQRATVLPEKRLAATLASISPNGPQYEALMELIQARFQSELVSAFNYKLTPAERSDQVLRAGALYHLATLIEDARETALRERQEELERQAK